MCGLKSRRETNLKTLLQDTFLIEKTKFVLSRELTKTEKMSKPRQLSKKTEGLQCRL